MIWYSLLVAMAHLVYYAWVYIMLTAWLADRTSWRTDTVPRLITWLLNLRAELTPLFWPATAVITWDTWRTGDNPLINTVVTVMLIGTWFVFPPNDNDRWKRRGKQLSEKIKNVAGKLRVVTVPQHA